MSRRRGRNMGVAAGGRRGRDREEDGHSTRTVSVSRLAQRMRARQYPARRNLGACIPNPNPCTSACVEPNRGGCKSHSSPPALTHRGPPALHSPPSPLPFHSAAAIPSNTTSSSSSATQLLPFTTGCYPAYVPDPRFLSGSHKRGLTSSTRLSSHID